MGGTPAKPLTPADEPDPWKRMEAATLELRRREFRATTPGERIERAFKLNDLANELREGMERGAGMSFVARRGLLLALARHEVRFVLIGGMAVIPHGYERATRDVDIVYDTAIENCERLAAALRELRAELLAADQLPRNGEINAEWPAVGGQFVFATAG